MSSLLVSYATLNGDFQPPFQCTNTITTTRLKHQLNAKKFKHTVLHPCIGAKQEVTSYIYLAPVCHKCCLSFIKACGYAGRSGMRRNDTRNMNWLLVKLERDESSYHHSWSLCRLSKIEREKAQIEAEKEEHVLRMVRIVWIHNAPLNHSKHYNFIYACAQALFSFPFHPDMDSFYSKSTVYCHHSYHYRWAETVNCTLSNLFYSLVFTY